MANKITRKLTDYVTLKMMVAGEAYDFEDKKTGKQITGVSKETIKIKFPMTTLTLLPHELKAIIDLSKDPEVMSEIESRIKSVE